jgi:hypothetical protein
MDGYKYRKFKKRKDSTFLFTEMRAYFHANYKKNLPDKSTRVNARVYTQVINLFNQKMIELMYTELYVFRMPFGLGSLCVGEEVGIRKTINKIVVPEKGKAVMIKVPNIGLKPTFRYWWMKQTTKLRNTELYYLYTCLNSRSYLGRYIQDRYDDPLKKNFRAHPILIN